MCIRVPCVAGLFCLPIILFTLAVRHLQGMLCNSLWLERHQFHSSTLIMLAGALRKCRSPPRIQPGPMSGSRRCQPWPHQLVLHISQPGASHIRPPATSRTALPPLSQPLWTQHLCSHMAPVHLLKVLLPPGMRSLSMHQVSCLLPCIYHLLCLPTSCAPPIACRLGCELRRSSWCIYYYYWACLRMICNQCCIATTAGTSVRCATLSRSSAHPSPPWKHEIYARYMKISCLASQSNAAMAACICQCLSQS